MEIEKKAQEAIKMIEIQQKELSDIVERTDTERNIESATERLKRWKSRTIKLLSEKIHPAEGVKLQEIVRNFSSSHFKDFEYDVNKYSAFLLSLKEVLETHPEDVVDIEPKKDSTVVAEEKPKLTTSGVIFIVHGHDEATKQSVARFLEKLELQPLILHEQPDKGRTIIEKLEASASKVNVAYTIVLLTPDDIGADVSTKDELQPRARQNVVFEMGYFIAKLGRERVRALYSEGVELPSDYQGVLYTKLDPAGAWQIELAREIKAAGIDVDLNKLV